MRSAKGFTLTELIIVMVIVVILSLIATPVYKGYVRRAMGTEAKALLNSIITAEKVYFTEYNRYKSLGDGFVTAYDKDLSVDARYNRYFTTWGVLAGGEFDQLLAIGVFGGKGTGADYISMFYLTYSTSVTLKIKPGLYEFYEPNGFKSLGMDEPNF